MSIMLLLEINIIDQLIIGFSCNMFEAPTAADCTSWVWDTPLNEPPVNTISHLIGVLFHDVFLFPMNVFVL